MPKNVSCNKSGRPNNRTIIKFSQQPISVISKLLKSIKEDKCNITIDLDIEQCREGNDLIEVNCITSPNVEYEQDDCILCQDCSHKSSNMQDHLKHARIHKGKQFSCDYQNCTYSTKLSSNLIKHKRTHTSEKPYLCDQCSFRTNFINSLKVHKRIHTDERPFSCNHCSYRCNSSSNLKKHCRHRHWNVDITPNQS